MSNIEKRGEYPISPEQQQAEEYCRHIERTLQQFHHMAKLKNEISRKQADGLKPTLSELATLEGLRFWTAQAADSLIHNSVWDRLKFHMHITLPEGEGIEARVSRNYVDIIEFDPHEFIALQVTACHDNQIDFCDPDNDLYLTVFRNRHKLKVQPIFPENLRQDPQNPIIIPPRPPGSGLGL